MKSVQRTSCEGLVLYAFCLQGINNFTPLRFYGKISYNIDMYIYNLILFLTIQIGENENVY